MKRTFDVVDAKNWIKEMSGGHLPEETCEVLEKHFVKIGYRSKFAVTSFLVEELKEILKAEDEDMDVLYLTLKSCDELKGLALALWVMDENRFKCDLHLVVDDPETQLKLETKYFKN